MRTFKIILAMGFIFTLFGMYSIMHSRPQPEVTRVMNPSSFSTPEEIGAVTFRRFWVEVQKAHVIVLASSAYLPEYDRPWYGFLAVARENKLEFFPDQTFEEARLRPLVNNSQPLDWDKVAVKMSALTDAGPKVLLHILASDENRQRVSQFTGEKLIFFQNLMPATDREKSVLQNGCRVAAPPSSGPNLDCAALSALSHGRRNKVALNSWSALIEQLDGGLELLLIHAP